MIIRVLTILLFMLSAQVTGAQNERNATQKLPGVVEFMPGDDGACKSEAFNYMEKSTGKIALLTRKLIEKHKSSGDAKQGYSCISDTTILLNKINSGESIVIDVRPTSMFNNYHIKDSINNPHRQIAEKYHLKDRSLVLVDEGYGSDDLYSLCSDLYEKGFKKVVVLDGGLNVWRKHGGLFTGLQGSGLQYITVHPRVVLSSQEYWLLVSITDKKNKMIENIKAIKHLIVHSQGKPTKIEDDLKYIQLARALKKRIDSYENRHKTNYNIAIKSQHGMDYSAISKAVDEVGIERVFYLEGGVEALEQEYKNYLATKNRVPLSKRMPKCKS